MNIDWKKLLHKKPDKREKILFVAMLVVILAMIFKVEFKKPSIKQVPQISKISQISKEKNKWIGTVEAVKDISETVLNSPYGLGVKITKSQFSPLTKDENRQKRDVTLSVVGDYYAMERYLNYLENMPAPLVINNFSIQKSAPDSSVLNLEISGVVYGEN